MAAPILAGLWYSAPYMTNGSIPTIAHVLEPETRPVFFSVGGHKLDLDRLGIAGEPTGDGGWIYPPGHKPFAGAVTIDTRKPGFSSRGHENEVRGLGSDDRRALIEYLKLL